jgi:hypothetical protein
VLEQWRCIVPRAAADEGDKTGGSRTSSSSLSPYAGGDLQNNQKHNRQLILIFLSFLVQIGSQSSFPSPSSDLLHCGLV